MRYLFLDDIRVPIEVFGYTKQPMFRDKVWEIVRSYNECAKWLVDYCIDTEQGCPEFYCHSMNPVGKDNILGLLNNFKKQ